VLDLKAILGYPDKAVDAEAATPDGPDTAAPSAAAPESSGGPARCDFSEWVHRPDCTGRMGWEPPDLPESARWWARREFDELPELVPPDNFRRATKPTAQGGPDRDETKLADLENVKRNKPSQRLLDGVKVGEEDWPAVAGIDRSGTEAA